MDVRRTVRVVSSDGFENESSPKAAMRSPVNMRMAGSLRRAILRTQQWLLAEQQPDGYWVGELEGDTILESEYILLLAFLGRHDTPDRPQGRPVYCRQATCPAAAGRCIPAAGSRSAAA